MIQIENVKISGWDAAIRGMRNPLNSWDRSDSLFVEDNYSEVGEADLELMEKLAKSGSTHAKYRRMIVVTMDITAPLYWWKEMETYRVGVVTNSCSTMHRIHAKEFTLDDFSHDHLSYEDNCLGFLVQTVEVLNQCRELYLETKNKKWWYSMIQLLPSSYNQRRTVMLNYEVLHHIYYDRKSHKLDEWRTFCNHILAMPFAKKIIRIDERDENTGE